MLRTMGSPICPATAASTGHFDFTAGEDSTWKWVVIAPITSVPPSSLMPARPEILRRSTRCLGWARRSFIAGSRLWPPAKSLASSLWRPSRSSASFIVPGVWYSNWAGYMSVSPLLLRFGGLDGLPDSLRRHRHRVDVVHSEARQGVHHRVDHRGRRGDGAGLSRAFHPQRVHRGGGLRSEEHTSELQ